MKTSIQILASVVLTLGASGLGSAAELAPATVEAWNAYLKYADLQMQNRLAGGGPLLWLDESPERAARVRRGEVVVTPVAGRGTESVPHGLIHDWIGAIFIPGVSLEDLWAVVHDYDNYEQMYRPVVASSRTLACSDTGQEFEMVWQRKVLFVRAAMQGRYQAYDVTLDAHRGFSIAESAEIREIEGYGHPNEHLLPAGTGNGFMWRIRSVARYEERDGGVYQEIEAVALTRDIPQSLTWMVKPVVDHLSINSLTTSLRQTRDAVLTPQRSLEASAACPNPARTTVQNERLSAVSKPAVTFTERPAGTPKASFLDRTQRFK